MLFWLFEYISTNISKRKINIETKEQKLVQIDAPFSDKISGLAVIKLLDKPTQSIILLKVRFMRNAAILDMTNGSLEILILIQKKH